MIHVVLIAAILLLLNLCWMCVSLHRRARSLELLTDDHERRLQLIELVHPRLVRIAPGDLGLDDPPLTRTERNSHAHPKSKSL